MAREEKFMSSTDPGRIVCPGCGRSGPYRPELAGKRLKCKCGGIIQVPARSLPVEASDEPLRPQPVAPAPSVPPDDPDAGYDIRETAETDNRPVQRPANVLAYGTGAAPAPPPETGPGAFPIYPRPKTYSSNSAAEQSHLIRMVIVIAAITVVIGGSIFGIRMLKGPGSSAPQLGEDADIEAKISDEYHKDVHAWFQEDPSRIMGPWTQTQALSQADRWQQQGAKQVLAFGSRISMVAVIELPDDPAKRKALFDWQAQWHREHLTKVWTDVGQKYLMIRLGI
jgi:hypothetical protein